MFKLRVKEVMDEKKVSMGKLSREANVPFNLVKRMRREPSTYKPHYDTLARVARYLRVPMEDLFLYEEDPPWGEGEQA